MLQTSVTVNVENEIFFKIYMLAFAIIATSFLFYKLKR